MNSSLIMTFLVAMITISTVTSAASSSSFKDSPMFQKFAAFNKISAGIAVNGKIALDAAATFPSDPKYGVIQMYTDHNCTHFLQGISVLLDTCMTNGVTSVKYTCNDQQINRYDYENTACNTLVRLEGYAAQCSSPDDISGGSIQMAVCGSSKAYDFPGSTVVFGNYQSETCNEQAVGGFGWKNLHCFAGNDDDDFESSWEFDYPYQYAYSTSDCSGPHLGSFKVTDQPCENGGYTDDAVFSDTYSGFSFKSAAFSNISIGMAAIFSTLMAIFYSMKN